MRIDAESFLLSSFSVIRFFYQPYPSYFEVFISIVSQPQDCYICDCLCVNVIVWLCVRQFVSLSICASVCVSVSVCVFFSPCIAVSIPLSACQHAYIYDMHIYSGVQRLENDRDQLLWNPNLGASIRPLVINTIFCYFIPHLHKEIRWMLEVIAPFADSISQHHSIFVRMSVCLRA